MRAVYINWARASASQFLPSFLQHKFYYIEFKMDAEQVDGRVMAKVADIVQENQQQLMQEMSSLLQRLSDQTSSSNEQQLLKISGIIATGKRPNLKRKVTRNSSS